jgi:uncharacterized protein
MTQSTPHTWTIDELRARRDDIIAAAEHNRAFNVRVFGSLARGDNRADSDIDFLVTFQPGSSIFDQVGLWLDLRDLLGCQVDLLTDHPEAGGITDAARAEAVTL